MRTEAKKRAGARPGRVLRLASTAAGYCMRQACSSLAQYLRRTAKSSRLTSRQHRLPRAVTLACMEPRIEQFSR